MKVIYKKHYNSNKKHCSLVSIDLTFLLTININFTIGLKALENY